MEILVFLPFFLLLVLGTLWWTSSLSQTIIEDWAQKNGYRLLEFSAPLLNKGLFFWTSSRGQTVYHFTIEDRAARTRSGWARCGSWMWGLMSQQIEIRWDDEQCSMANCGFAVSQNRVFYEHRSSNSPRRVAFARFVA